MKSNWLKKITILSVLTLGLNSTISPITTFAKENPVECIQNSSTESKATESSPPIVYSVPDEYVFGDWNIVRYLGFYKHTFTSQELLTNSIIEQTIFFGLGLVSAGETYLLGIAKTLNDYKTVDVKAIGGVYTKSYYVRKIVYPSQASLNVPVLYEFEYWTIFYNNELMRNTDIVYINRVSDGSRLDSN